MSSDEMPIDTGIVFLGHEGKQNMPILKKYINSPLAQLGNRSGPPFPLLSRGLKVLYQLNLNKTPFSLIVTYRYIYIHTSVCVCIYIYVFYIYKYLQKCNMCVNVST